MVRSAMLMELLFSPVISAAMHTSERTRHAYRTWAASAGSSGGTRPRPRPTVRGSSSVVPIRPGVVLESHSEIHQTRVRLGCQRLTGVAGRASDPGLLLPRRHVEHGLAAELPLPQRSHRVVDAREGAAPADRHAQ